MVLLHEKRRTKIIALYVYLAYFLSNPLLRNLAYRNLHEEHHIVTKAYLISSLLVCRPKLKHIDRVKESIEQVFLISLYTILIELHLLQIGGNVDFYIFIVLHYRSFSSPDCLLLPLLRLLMLSLLLRPLSGLLILSKPFPK